MSTNYYLMTKEHKYKGELGSHCELIDDPYFGYSLHLLKISYGWLPLFELHKGVIESVADIKILYDTGDFEIRDEYDGILTWEQFFEEFEKRYAQYRSGDRELLVSHIENKRNDRFPIAYKTDENGYEFADAQFS